MIRFAEKLAVAPAYFVEGFGSGSKTGGDTIKSAAPSSRSPPAMRLWRCWPATRHVAQTIIELSQHGVRGVATLHAMTVKEFQDE
jgi:hypothetical protein